MLVFVFGSTTFATATVLAVFMGGLALGSFLAGRQADRIKRPFLWYGILEGIIGGWALLAPHLFDMATPLYRIIWQNFHLSLWPFSIIRFCVALLILIVPTTCMGATLPLLAKFVTTSLEYVGKKIGTLYAANTLGAVGGAAVGGLYLLPTVGLAQTTQIAALINFLLIAIVVYASKSLEAPKENTSPAQTTNTASDGMPNEDSTAPGSTTPDSSDTSTESGAGAGITATAGTRLSPQALAAMISIAASGAVAMVYEVGWTRTLLMVIGSSTYAFTLMLTSFLLGIFLGSLACARLIDRAKEPLAWLAVLQFLVAGASLFSMDRFNSVPYWNLQLNAAFPSDPNTALLARFFIAASMMMPLTFFLGAVFPAAVKACVKDLSAVGRSVGSLYSANTLGAIVGAFLAGFVLVPVMGVEKSLIFGTAINIVTGIALLFMVNSVRPALKIVVLLVGAAAGCFLFARPEIWDRQVIVYAQQARRKLAETKLFSSAEDWRQGLAASTELVFYEDGASSTVGVIQSKTLDNRSLVTNGHVDASDGGDMSTQVLLAAAPIAANPKAQDIAVIGWGSGVTIAAASHLTNGKITAIELEPAVVKTSKFFHRVNGAPENDPRVKIEVNDGRNFLLATDQKFDVIISEPSNPWQAGVCNLFTKEYFTLCKERLRPGGVFGLWCQIAEVPPQNVRGVLSALHQVFPYCAVLRMDEGNIVGLASQTPITIDFEHLRQSIKNKAVFEDLKRAALDSPEDLVARFCVAPENMDNLIANTPPNNDDTNRLEYEVGRTYENSYSLNPNNEMFNRNCANLDSLLSKKDSPLQMAQTMCAIARKAQINSNWEVANSWIQSSLKAKPTAEAYRLLGIAEFQHGKQKEAYQLWDKALQIDPGHVETLQTLGLTFLDDDRVKAREQFNRVLAVEPTNKVARFRVAQTYGPHFISRAYVEESGEDPQNVLKNLSDILSDKEFVHSHPAALFLQAWANYKLGRIQEALPAAQQALELDHDSLCIPQILGNIYYSLGRFPESWSCWQRVLIGGPKVVPALVERAREHMKANRNSQALAVLETALEVSPLNVDAMKAVSDLAGREQSAAKVYASIEKLRKILSHK